MSISVTGTTTTGSEVKIGKNTMKRNDVNFEDRTDAEGRANFVIDTPGNVKSMKIRVSIVFVWRNSFRVTEIKLHDLSTLGIICIFF